MKTKLTGLVFALMMVLMSADAIAQCPIDIKQFQAGEQMTYDLYFKYGLIYKKAGVSTLKVSPVTYGGQSAYKASLTAKTQGVVNKLYSLNDTLSSIMTTKLVPLEFIKKAHEGKDDTDERTVYTYEGGKTNIHAKRIRNGEQRFDERMSTTSCVYDMVSVVYYARTIDYSKMKKGDVKSVEFMSGKRKALMVIEYEGIETIEANDDKKYSCIKLVLSIANGNKDAFQDKEEAMKVYITNDNNRMPIRLDSKLKIGTTRAFLKSYRGNMYPVKSVN